MRRGLTGRRVTVTLTGGPLEIEWTGEGRIVMTGAAAESFRGTFDPADYGAPRSRGARDVEVVSLGCRLKHSESETLRAMLADAGELTVINSCAVTAEAMRQTRQAIRRAEARPGIGCW